jgi:hypothetical protein
MYSHPDHPNTIGELVPANGSTGEAAEADVL